MTTPRTAFVAIAASTAEPPARSTQAGGGREVMRRDDRAVRPAASGTGTTAGPSVMPAPVVDGAGPRRRRVLLVAAQPGQRQERDEQQRRPWRSACPSMPRQSAATPPIERPDDLADGEEHLVQAHDRATIGGNRSEMSASRPERGRRRAGQHEQAEAGDDDRRADGHHEQHAVGVVDRQPGADQRRRRRGSRTG